jgi:hypothetical protein
VKLYQLPPAFAALEALVAENGELPPDALEKLDELEATLQEKLDGCCRVMRQFEAEARAYASESGRLARQAQIATNGANRLKRYMQDTMERLGTDREATPLFRLRLQNNPPSVHIVDAGITGFVEDGCPEEFLNRTVALNKTAVLQAHKEGRALPPGVTVTQTSSLRIT